MPGTPDPRLRRISSPSISVETQSTNVSSPSLRKQTGADYKLMNLIQTCCIGAGSALVIIGYFLIVMFGAHLELKCNIDINDKPNEGIADSHCYLVQRYAWVAPGIYFSNHYRTILLKDIEHFSLMLKNGEWEEDREIANELDHEQCYTNLIVNHTHSAHEEAIQLTFHSHYCSDTHLKEQFDSFKAGWLSLPHVPAVLDFTFTQDAGRTHFIFGTLFIFGGILLIIVGNFKAKILHDKIFG